MKSLFENENLPYGSVVLPDAPVKDDELFRSYIGSINNAIGNKAKYDFYDVEDKEKFIDTYLEELIFCMHNDREFSIEVLEVPSEFHIVREGGDFFYLIKDVPHRTLVSPEKRKDIKRIYKNPQHGLACIYRFCPLNHSQPIYLVNFVHCENDDKRKTELYKRVIPDYMELKNIDSLSAMRKVIIASYQKYKKQNS